MNEQILTLGLMILNAHLQRAAEVSARIQAGTLDMAALDEYVAADDKARDAQLLALAKAKEEGR